MVFVGLFALLPGASYAQIFVPGDLNDDGSFNVVDSVVLSRALLAMPPGITQGCVDVPGDVSNNGIFDAGDSAYARNVLLGLPPAIAQTGDPDDADCDGYEIADGDCNNTNPLVNPGAYDYPVNGIDDDCVGGDAAARQVCDGGLPSNESSPLNYARALDLCPTTVESPPASERVWGVISGAFTLASNTDTPAAAARSIRPAFGSNNPPRFGNAMSVFSTGTAAATGQISPAHAAFQTGLSQPSSGQLPQDWLAANSGTPPVAPGCPAPSDPLVGRDSVMLRLRIRVPTNAQSFRLAAKHFNSDYPENTCGPFNDYFLVLLTSGFSGSPANPADKNLAVLGGLEVGANLVTLGAPGLFQDCLNGPTGCAIDSIPGNFTSCTGTSGLTGTGMDVLDPPGFPEDGIPGWCGSSNMAGGATAWLAVGGNVVPGETIEIRLVIWDAGDGLYDSLVLLDDFRWSPNPITPGAVAN